MNIDLSFEEKIVILKALKLRMTVLSQVVAAPGDPYSLKVEETGRIIKKMTNVTKLDTLYHKEEERTDGPYKMKD